MRKAILASVALALAATGGMWAYAANEGAPSEGAFVGWPLTATGKSYADVDGHHLWQYVKELSDIAKAYRDAGHPQFWGRISGTSGDEATVAWLTDKFKRIGLSDVHAQPMAFLDPQWAPDSWEVSAGERKLTSAQPPYGTVDTAGKVLDLPVVYVGLGSDADFAGRDVKGKAVLLVRGEIAYGIGPADVVKRAEDAGAAVIFSTDLRGGNYKALAYRTTAKIPTFNLGTEDGLALRDMVAKAPSGAPPHVKVRLTAKWVSGQKSALVWGTLPGMTDETVYVTAHRDGWFEAAGDNASGVATMLGIAEHFAKVPKEQRKRTMVFVGLDGHHHIPDGAYGTWWLYSNKDKFFSKTALLINAEHPAEMLTHSGQNGKTGEVIPMWWYAGGASRPQLKKIAMDAFHEFGVPLWVEERAVSGDMSPFKGFLPGVIAQSSDFMQMHTDGDTPEIVAWSGLESVVRAYARVVDEVNKLPLSDLQRPEEAPYKTRATTPGCAAWLKDSGAFCSAKN